MCALRGSRHGCWVHAEEQCPRGTISVGAAWGGGPVVGPLSPGGKERIVINLSLGPTAQAGGDREWAPEDEEGSRPRRRRVLPGEEAGRVPAGWRRLCWERQPDPASGQSGRWAGLGPHCPSAQPLACRSGHQVQWQGLHAEVCCKVCEQEHAPWTRLPPNESQVGPHLACRAAPPALISNKGLSVPRTSAVPHSL